MKQWKHLSASAKCRCLSLFLAGVLSMIAIVPSDSKLWAADGAALLLSNSAIDENQVPGTVVGTFHFTGQDLADTADYTLVSGEGDTGNDNFVIEGDILRSAAVFDFEAQNIYSIRVRREGVIASAEEIFIITVGDVNEDIPAENAPPVITEGESVTVDMEISDSPLTINLNAVDPDSDSLTWEIITPAAYGPANITGPKTGDAIRISYNPTANYHGTDSFTVQVSDGELTDTITITVYVRPKSEDACDAVCAQANKCGKVYMDEDGSPQDFSLTLNARDPDNDVLTWSISVPALYGAAFASGTGYTKEIAYIPNADYNGADSFEVQVSDGQLSDSITICVSISPQNDPPKFLPVNVPNATQHLPYTLTVAASDPDAGDMLVIRASEIPEWLTLTDNGNGTAALTGTPATDAQGLKTDYRVQLEVRDAYGETASQSFVIHVAENAVFVPENNNNSAEENPPQEAETDAPTPVITVTQTDHLDPVQPGELLTYTIICTNAGSGAASDVVITETYDENVSFVSANPVPDPGTDHQWTLASLNPGDSGTISVTVLVKSPTARSVIRNSVAADIDTETVVSHEDTGVFKTVFGDIDESGAVDLKDAVFALQTLCGMSTPPVFVSGDVNGDRRIGIEEVVYILQTASEMR